jgi:carboxyl-terminal processing protease
MRILLLALSVALTSCVGGNSASVDTTAFPASPATTSTAAPAPTSPLRIEIQGCGSAQTRPWSLLCAGHRLVTEHHVDTPEAASLAAAAVAGVRLARPDPDAALEPSDDRTWTCVIPDAAYSSLCEAMADGLTEGISLERLVEASVQGLFRFGLDPFSAYLAPDYAERIDALGSGQVASLGMIVAAQNEIGHACGPIDDLCLLRVLAVFDFTPSAHQGVLVGDVITAIDGAPTAGLSEAEAVAALHADAGTATVITVDRSTGSVDKTLVHEDIPIAAVEYGMVTETIGYLRINDFSQEAAQAVGQVLSLPEMQAASGLVLDMRDNPGGLVMSARAVASQFLREGIVGIEETRTGVIELPVIRGGLAPDDMAVIVIVNRGTASAAEIVAAALQGQNRAQIVGERTFGKNLVQEGFAAPGGGQYRITVARWAGPDGLDVGTGGLIPDVIVDETAPGDDPALDLALSLLGG